MCTPVAYPADLAAPVAVGEVDLDAPAAPALCASSTAHSRALVLVRQRRRPVGFVHVNLERLPSDEALADQIAMVLGLPAGADADVAELTLETSRWRPAISVVVATRNRSARLADSLAAIVAVTRPDTEIVVVDNAPVDDATRQVVDAVARRDHRVRYVLEPRPGLSRARNRGLGAATGDVVAYVDDDVRVDRLWAVAIEAAFTTGAAPLGCVTGTVLPVELETRAQVLFERFGGLHKGLTRQVFDLGTHRPPDRLFPYRAGRFGTGGNMAFARSVLCDVGGFDERLGAGTPARGGEDLDVFVRVVRAGHILMYEPAAIVWHHHHREEAALRAQIESYGIGLGAFLTKHLLDVHTGPGLLARSPAGLVHLLSPASAKNARKGADFPRSLTRAERRGMATAPARYLAARRRSPTDDPFTGGRP